MSRPDPTAPTDSIPGRSQFGPTVDRFDASVDDLIEMLRGHTLADRLFVGASHAGDWSAIWHTLSLARGLARRRPDQIVALALAIGAESLIVNQGVKRLFRRARPTASGDGRFRVRTPTTTAFPSGHASAAAFAASTLIAWDGKRWAPWWVVVAATVAISRVYVRVHHASDVVGGAMVGSALAALARPALRRYR